ncbi:hypothetical protein BJX70DRAFT_257721 [Aspergillus crustosus]
MPLARQRRASNEQRRSGSQRSRRSTKKAERKEARTTCGQSETQIENYSQTQTTTRTATRRMGRMTRTKKRRKTKTPTPYPTTPKTKLKWPPSARRSLIQNPSRTHLSPIKRNQKRLTVQIPGHWKTQMRSPAQQKEVMMMPSITSSRLRLSQIERGL